MKFSEVIKALEENPIKTFEMIKPDGYKYVISAQHINYFSFDVYNPEGKLMGKEFGMGGFHDNIKTTECNWQEVRESVSYQKAFEKWVQGYKVSFTDKQGLRYEVDPLEFKVQGDFISRNDIEMSKWFVED